MLPKAYPYLDADGNFGIRAGDDWLQTLTAYTDEAGTDPYDFSNCAALLQVRDKKDALLLQATTADGSILLGGAAGTLEIALSATATDVAPGVYTYGLQITDRDGKESTWLTGAFEIARKIVHA